MQIVVQALGLIAGLLLVRTLPQREYAYFTLANTMQATLLLLADVGVNSALSSTGGVVWQDRRRFGELVRTGLHVRKSLFWIGGSVAIPVMAWLLLSNGTGIPYAVVLIAVVLLGVNFRLTNDVLTIVPKLHARIDQLQKLDLVAAAFRLLALGAACLTFVNAAVGVLVASLSFGIQHLLLRRWAAEGADLQASPNPEDRRTIFRVIRQQAPNTIYYCVQSQLTVFLISIFGNTRTLAEVGALGRLAMLFAIIGSIMTSIVQPRFARCQDKTRLKAMWWRIIGSYLMLSGFLMALALFLPKPFLWLLGKHYAHLEHELALIVFATIINTLAGLIYGLNSTRAWMKGAWLSIPLTILTQAALIPFFNLGTIQGVVFVTCLPIIPGMIPFLYRTYQSIKHFSPEMPLAVGN